jgi:hypothetical protein
MHPSRLLLAALVALAVGACGAAAPSNSSSAVAAAAAGKRASILAFAKCMRAHGVPNFPDPGIGQALRIQASKINGGGQSMSVNGVPVNAPAFQAAMQTCHSKLPNGGRGSASPQQLAQLQRSALAMARCMRAHGIRDFPDPQVSGSGGGISVRIPGGRIDMQSPAFQAAQKVCMPLMQKGGAIATP